MKVVILAGGLGTRISEETHLKPKPMIEIGENPLLWHIMKIYTHYGLTDFLICLGYKGVVIKQYFINYRLYQSDVTMDFLYNQNIFHNQPTEPWRVTLVETGYNTQTGGRLKRLAKYLQGEEMFCFTYGDGVANINIQELIEFHKTHGKLATVTAVQPPGRFGALAIDGDRVKSFMEKPQGDGSYINGGFFVLSPKVLDLIASDETVWEKEPLETLAQKEELMTYKHQGFWQPVDTLRDKNYLEELWKTQKAPWKVW